MVGYCVTLQDEGLHEAGDFRPPMLRVVSLGIEYVPTTVHLSPIVLSFKLPIDSPCPGTDPRRWKHHEAKDLFRVGPPTDSFVG